jgi:hypothetical protein
MLRSICTLTLLAIFIASPAWAQKPAAKTQPIAPAVGSVVEKATVKPQATTASTTISPGEIKATPEMWFYEQYMHQYQDPKVAVRANAEFRADQRRRRLASMQWFGFSNIRPHACSDPVHSDYSPGWASNNSSYPYRWSGVGPTWYMARPEPAAVYTY